MYPIHLDPYKRQSIIGHCMDLEVETRHNLYSTFGRKSDRWSRDRVVWTKTHWRQCHTRIYRAWNAVSYACHWRQEPFCVDRKTYAKLSAFVKYAIKFVGRANPITNFEFSEEHQCLCKNLFGTFPCLYKLVQATQAEKWQAHKLCLKSDKCARQGQ